MIKQTQKEQENRKIINKYCRLADAAAAALEDAQQKFKTFDESLTLATFTAFEDALIAYNTSLLDRFNYWLQYWEALGCTEKPTRTSNVYREINENLNAIQYQRERVQQ